MAKITRIDPAVEKTQREKLQRIKRQRDQEEVDRALAVVKRAAQGSDNLIPPILNAVKCYATVGEISDTLRSVFGEYEEKT